MKDVIPFLIVIVLIFCSGVLLWQLERHLNYSLSYENMVRATVREMVKPEALKP